MTAHPAPKQTSISSLKSVLIANVSGMWIFKPSVVIHTDNLSPGGAKAGRQAEARLVYLVSLGQPGLYNETLSWKDF